MEATFTKDNCPRCNYVLAEKKVSKDGSQERFTCLRCGYHYLITNGERQEHLGLGSWCIVGEKGIGASGIYIDEKFFESLDKIYKAFSGGKLFYTKLSSADNKFYLVNPRGDGEPEIEFSDDMEICFEGLRKHNRLVK